jgi:hypothetical protein
MTEKSKFDGKPSASFFQFTALWMLWSALIGLVTTLVLATSLPRLAFADGLQMTSLLIIGGELVVGGFGVFALSRWQRQTLFKKTGREIKRWAGWSTFAWIVGLILALIITVPLMIDAQQDLFVTIGSLGLGLTITYAVYSIVQSWLLSAHIDYTWMYMMVMVASVFFWALFVGDPRKIALGGLLAPALQGMFSGIALMWLFHLSKLGNIAIKSKNETIQELT